MKFVKKKSNFQKTQKINFFFNGTAIKQIPFLIETRKITNTF